MRHLIIICLLIAFCITGCKDGLKNVVPQSPTSYTSVVGDRTDSIIKEPDECEVLQSFDIDNTDNVYNGVTFRFKDVECVSLTDVKTYSVEPTNWLFSSRRARIASLKAFKSRVKETLMDARKEYGGTQNQSKVFQTVAVECNFLSSCDPYSKRTLILYSNCLDNSADLNLYNPIVMNLVQTHPEQVMASLEKVVKIQPLNGVHVYIVYQSLNPDDERHFLIASNFYRYVLSQHGATVEIVPTLPNAKVGV